MESSNQIVVLDHIPFSLDVASIIRQMHLHGDARRYESNLRELIDIVTPVARPRALYKVGCVDKKEVDSLEIDGVHFNNRLVRDNLDQVNTVFICLATAGVEVENLEIPQDVIRRFCLDAIKNSLLFSASEFLQNYIMQHYASGPLSNMNPGEGKAFPIDQQRNLFAILGDVEKLIGVRLTANCALIPTKSTSGIYFSRDIRFISCQLCPQKGCQGRRAAFNPEMADKYSKPRQGQL